MCGIAGFAGDADVVTTALEGIRRLEYRGYDSAGVAYCADGRLVVERCPGKVNDLAARLADGVQATAAIAHTRWATHGAPTEANAHPHRDCTSRLAVVHNGIIENHAELRRDLTRRGHRFTSDTDTEVIAHLLEEELERSCKPHSLADSLRRAMAMLTGSYALAVLCADAPETIIVARNESPLLVGRGKAGTFVASDAPALIGWASRMAVLDNGDVAAVRRDGVEVLDRMGSRKRLDWQPVPEDRRIAEKGGYAHFMLKEIHEEPVAVAETLRGRLGDDGRVTLKELPSEMLTMLREKKVHFVACGTAYHVGLYGQRLFRNLLRRPAEAEVASEFRYDDPLVDEDSLVVLISQSGETADTLAAGREARRRGAATLAVVNCAGSSLVREADATLLTRAGPEISVASTKAYTAQVVALALLAGAAGGAGLGYGLGRLADALRETLSRANDVAAAADGLKESDCFFFLGRGYDAAVAVEGALKLKEVSYVHAEAYPAGEMKHGPLALIEPGVTVVGICTRKDTHAKMCANLMEARARDGTVLAILREDLPEPEAADIILRVPVLSEPLMPPISMAMLQLLAYHIALRRGCPIDQPRNLAKSVTVE
jgi:glucosamine--fructose-6-phosphate aminotransferase (isomerizing)